MKKAVFRCHPSGAVKRGYPVRAADWLAACTKLRVYHTLGSLALAFTLLLGTPAKAQNATVARTQPTQDEVLYGKHASAACSPKLAKKEVVVRPDATPCLNRRERRARRRLYQDQHRDEFPALYYPGVE